MTMMMTITMVILMVHDDYGDDNDDSDDNDDNGDDDNNDYDGDNDEHERCSKLHEKSESLWTYPYLHNRV
jgi:hypothetical protein